jgi:pilus assembly protein FimV
LNKFINIIFIVSLFASSAQALELGQAKLLSHLNEPLKANISLGRVQPNALADLHFSLADQDTYRSMGLDKPFYLDALKFELIAGNDQQHFVQVSTRQRVREPILDLFIKLEGMQGSLTRLYTLMLDPRELAASIKQPVPKALPHAKKTPVINPAQAPQPMSTVAVEPAVQTSATESSAPTLLVENDSISIIAQNSSLHEKYSVYQIMRAFYLLNPQAFIKGNINHLQAGSRLVIPSPERVAEVPRQQAVNFVYAKSKNFTATRRSEPKPKAPKPKPELARTDLGKASDERAEQALSEKSVRPPQKFQQPNRATTNRAAKLDDGIRQDVEDWRNMADEFSNLSFIVQTQNSVLKTHGDVLKHIDARIENESRQLAQLQQRIENLENATVAPAFESSAAIPASSIANPEQMVAGEVSREQSATSNMIELINLRLEALEQQTKQPEPQQPGEAQLPQPAPAVAVSVPVAAIQSPQAEPQSPETFPLSLLIGQNKGWLIAVLTGLAALLLLALREMSWRRKVKALTSPVEIEIVQDTEAEKETPQVDLEIEQPPESTTSTDVDIELEQSPELNLQFADEKYEQAVAQARGFKFDQVERSDDDESAQDDEALYAEIDILIAYQLYDEALKMVQSSQRKMPTNLCLDIRELEILAYLNKEDLFLQKYDAKKELLSAEFTDAWEKIEKLHDEMDTTYPRIVTL